MDQVVVVGGDLELGAQEMVAELLGDRPLKGAELQLHTGVVGLVFLRGTQPSTCVGNDPTLSILLLRQNSTLAVMACVCLEDEGLGEISKLRDRSCSQCSLQLIELPLVLLTPQLGDISPFLFVM